MPRDPGDPFATTRKRGEVGPSHETEAMIIIPRRVQRAQAVVKEPLLFANSLSHRTQPATLTKTSSQHLCARNESTNMSTEAYVPPTLIPQPGQSAAPGVPASSNPKTTYICGECNTKVSLSRLDTVRCYACGHRVLYKERTNR